jgi:5-(carboxyamino)imidazole ribonucleotide synthase
VNQKVDNLPRSRGRVGVLGGGQLGRMMAIAGIPLGLEFVFLDPSAEACAGPLGELMQADFSDAGAARRMASMVDVATFDFENVPQETASALEELKPLYPPSGALGSCQDRLVEKEILTGLGIRVAPYHAVSSRTDLLDGLDLLSYPAVLKTRRLGYDGKGQALIRDQEDLERAWQALGDFDLILEAFVPFEAECSLIAVRGIDGETRFWPLTRNLHASGILTLSLAGDFDQSLEERAQSSIQAVLDHFGYVGVLTLEFFVLDGELLVNEIAPRVHNSGHWTIDGAETSQFENHVRAITAMPLGGTSANREALMFNWIGQMPDREQILSIPGVHWHDYGKSARPGRKIGHATLTADTRQELVVNAHTLARAAGGTFPDLLNRILPQN